MEINGLLVFTVIYGTILVFTLVVLHLFHKELGVPDYSNSVKNDWLHYNDDWESNIDAYACFSAFWPLTWVILLIYNFYRLLMFISKQIYNIVNKDNGSKKI